MAKADHRYFSALVKLGMAVESLRRAADYMESEQGINASGAIRHAQVELAYVAEALVKLGSKCGSQDHD